MAGAKPIPRAALWGLLAAAACAVAWSALQPSRPLVATDDLYTHLSVARHLARGDGFLTDVAYPLSFAFPFAARLPQPLIHRPPGFAVLVAPYALAGGDPAAAVRVVVMQRVFGLVLWLGAAAWLRRGRPGAAAAWLVLMATNLLLSFAASWGEPEIVVGAVLLVLWLRARDAVRPGAGDGALAAALALLRPELLPLPLFWWWRHGLRDALVAPVARRRCLVALVVFAAAVTPWCVRNLRLTGNPFFSLQAQAELVKDTRPLPQYTVYRQLQPHPLAASLLREPLPVARKTYRGLRFYVENAHRLVPWPLLLVGLGCLGYPWLRRRPLAAPDAAMLRAPATAMLSLLGLMAFYAPFDHSVRHLAVLIPVLVWETAPFVTDHPLDWARRRRGRGPWPAWLAFATGAGAAAVLAWLTAAPLPGWQGAVAVARADQELVARETAALRAAAPDEAFVTTSAAPWFADRPAVWSPAGDAVRDTIRVRLAAARGAP